MRNSDRAPNHECDIERIQELVARQKLMHLVSGILTCAAALGIAFYYFLQPKLTRLLPHFRPDPGAAKEAT